MNEPEHDDELEQFLRRRSPLHRRLADIDHAEPSMELDRIVLNRAREAIETPAQPPMFRGSRWAMPVGLAATILIAFTLVLNVEHQPKQAAAQELATTAAQAEAPGAVADYSGPAPAELAASAGSANSSNYAKASTPASAAARKREATAGVSPPMAASMRDADDSAATSSDVGAAATVPAAPPAVASSNAMPTEPLVESKAEASAARATAAATAAGSDNAAHSDAESWLREIARLRAEGKNDAADRELAAFRRAYPSHSGTSLAQPPTR